MPEENKTRWTLLFWVKPTKLMHVPKSFPVQSSRLLFIVPWWWPQMDSNCDTRWKVLNKHETNANGYGGLQAKCAFFTNIRYSAHRLFSSQFILNCCNEKHYWAKEHRGVGLERWKTYCCFHDSKHISLPPRSRAYRVTHVEFCSYMSLDQHEPQARVGIWFILKKNTLAHIVLCDRKQRLCFREVYVQFL